MTAPLPPGPLIRSIARDVARRMAAEQRSTHALRSVVGLVDADEDDLAFDHLVHVVAHHRFPVLRSEYDRLLAVAARLGEVEWFVGMGIERLVEAEQGAVGQFPAGPGHIADASSR
ncbi:hypothetical protein [Streptomyces sp. NPDC012510]|uniref:hypothetical protein n=1 Tax=Streptomyces sp. NPDC012510 TaxID=3364838 RepID=UPI0036EB79CD